MKDLWYRRTTCRLCGSADVPVAVPLRPIPVLTPNIGVQDGGVSGADLAASTVPLDLHLCGACGHLQILAIIDPEVQYTNFRYTTSVSLGLPEHFRTMAGEVLSRCGLTGAPAVLEIGSNDGTLLRAFQEHRCTVLGVDPARATADAATAAGVETLATFFDEELGRTLRDTRGPMDLVVCNNTFANIDTLDGVVAGIKAVLAPGGVFVFETSYGVDVVSKTLIDTVYHEHLSYFMVRPLDRFFAAHGLELFDIDHIWTKGGSIRGYVQRTGGARRRTKAVDAMIAAELEGGFDGAGPYAGFAARVAGARARLHQDLDAVGAGTIGGYGASVGTVTMLHQFDLVRRLSVLFDDKPLGDRLQGPGYDLPILRSDALYELHPAAVVILAWRYADPIRARHRRYLDEGGRFLLPALDSADL